MTKVRLMLFMLITTLPATWGHALDRNQTSAMGKSLAFERVKGNCLACHAIDDGELPGNAGPPLRNMKQNFPDRKRLRAQIWDATANNPQTLMPPFGRHRILTESEIDLIVDYLYTL